MNARKRDYDTVLDPFTLAPDTFRLELITGRIHPNKSLPSSQQQAAAATIKRLGLDDAGNRKMRVRRFQDYLMLKSDSVLGAMAPEAILKRDCPLIWFEAKRQHLL